MFKLFQTLASLLLCHLAPIWLKREAATLCFALSTPFSTNACSSMAYVATLTWFYHGLWKCVSFSLHICILTWSTSWSFSHNLSEIQSKIQVQRCLPVTLTVLITIHPLMQPECLTIKDQVNKLYAQLNTFQKQKYFSSYVYSNVNFQYVYLKYYK